MVGPWQPPTPQYRLDYVLRNKDGFVFSKPSLSTGLNQEVTMKQGVQIPPDFKTSIMQVDLTPQRETPTGLEMGVKWSLQEGTTKVAAPGGETLLFTTPQGIQVFVAWRKVADPETAAARP
jgi:hypothetical protein